ncbi:MAG: hypothetical protein D3924_11990, partial [Candidatus Electrothrix sp. AR4]|nr:hypothetical protein [Candidatus Electrothrix sp. AR4]
EELLAPEDLYNAGFALAQSGRFSDCLSYWRKIQSEEQQFLAQKVTIAALFIQELAGRLTENPMKQVKEIRQLLHTLSDSGVKLEQIPVGEELVNCCRSLYLAWLWQEGRVREIRNVISEVDLLNPSVLEVQAKAAYQVIETEGVHASPIEVRHFIDCWLSALFHPAVLRTLPGKKTDMEEHRLELLDSGRRMVCKYAEQQVKDGDQFVQQWEEDLALLKMLTGLSVLKKKDTVPVYTPTLARQAGIFEQLFALVQKNRDTFAEHERYIAVGAAYSPIAPALLMARSKKYDEVLRELVPLERNSVDPFIAYGFVKVKIACGMHYLHKGEHRKAEKILIALLPLLTQSASQEQHLLALLDRDDKHYDADWLAVSVNVLTQLQKYTSASNEVKKALCSVLTRQTVLLHNEGKIHIKVLLQSMEKAVAFNPNDEFARMTLEDARVELEIIEMRQAVNHGKLAKAARIAKSSPYKRVFDQFFEFAAQVVDQIEGGDFPDKETGLFMLRQLLQNVLRVDPDHAIVQGIECTLDDLEERVEVG